jgi:hypothetical protein
LELCGLVHYSSRALVTMEKAEEGKGKRAVKQEKEIGIRIVYLVCYAKMLCSLRRTTDMLLDSLPEVCMDGRRLL